MRRNYFRHTKVTKRLCVRQPDVLDVSLYRGKHNLRYYRLEQREPNPDPVWTWMSATARYPHEVSGPLTGDRTIYVFKGRSCQCIYRQLDSDSRFPIAVLIWGQPVRGCEQKRSKTKNECIQLSNGKFCVSEAYFRKYLKREYGWKLRRKKDGNQVKLQIYWMNRPITLLGLVRDDFYETKTGEQARKAQEVIQQFEVYQVFDATTCPVTLRDRFVLTE